MEKSMDAVYLNSDDYRLLKILLANGPIKLEDLANSESVSTRTMQKYIHAFSTTLGNIAEVRISQAGYFLHIHDYQKFSALQSGSLKQHLDINDQQKRQAEILLNLILNTNDYVVIDELADEYLIGRNTLLKDLKVVRSWLDRCKIDLAGVTSRGIKLEVKSNADLVMLIYNHVYDYSQINFPIPADLSQKIANQLAGQHIKDKTIQVFIKVLRIVAFLKQRGLEITGVSENYHNLVKETPELTGLIKIIEHAYGISFSKVEAEFIMFPFNIYSNDLLDKTKLNAQIQRNEVLFKQIVVDMQNLVATRIDYDVFYQQIKYHLVFLIQRAVFHISPSDYMTDKMIQRFQLAADLAILFVEKLSNYLNITIKDVEVNYLTVYFELTLKQGNVTTDSSLKVGFLSSMGTSIQQYLQSQLDNIFESNVEIIRFGSEQELQAHKGEVLMVFTDHPLLNLLDVPTVMVGDIFRDRSFELKVKASVTQYAIEDGQIIWNVTRVHNKAAATYEKILTDATKEDIRQGFVGKEFTKDLLAHEAVSKFILENGLVIPHVVASTRADGILLHLCILDNPVQVRNMRVKYAVIIGIPRVLSQQKVQTLGVIYDLLFLIDVNDTAIMNLDRIIDSKNTLTEVMEGL